MCVRGGSGGWWGGEGAMAYAALQTTLLSYEVSMNPRPRFTFLCLLHPRKTVIDLISLPLRKHAYSNILKILPPKNGNFQIKTSDIFHMSAQNIDCGYSLEPPRRGGSNEYPQSMFLSRNKEIIYTPVNPSFTISRWGLKGSVLHRHVFVMTAADKQCRVTTLRWY